MVGWAKVPVSATTLVPPERFDVEVEWHVLAGISGFPAGLIEGWDHDCNGALDLMAEPELQSRKDFHQQWCSVAACCGQACGWNSKTHLVFEYCDIVVIGSKMGL